MNQSKGKNGYVWVMLTALSFGTMEVACKMAGSSFSALQLTFLRFFIGGLILLPFALADRKKRERLTAGDWLYLLLLGVVCICVSMSLFQIGVMRTNANLAAVIISINPAFTMLFAHFLTDEKMTKKKGLVLLICILGLLVFAGPGELTGGSDVSGILITLAASVAFGLYTAMGKRRIGKIGGMTQNSFSFLLGSAVLALILCAAGEPVFQGITGESLPLLVYLGVVVTGFGYVCYLKAIAVSGPSTASIAFFIKPALALVLAALLLSEPITAHGVIGLIIIIAGFLYNLFS